MTVGLSCGVEGVCRAPVGGAAGLRGVVMEGVPAPFKSTPLPSSEDELSYKESELAACMGDELPELLGNRVDIDTSVKLAVVL